MKHRLYSPRSVIQSLIAVWFIIVGIAAPLQVMAGGTWAPLASGPPVGINNCLLLSDGTVLGMNGAGQCAKLTPDIHGSYINGSWTSLPTMHNGRLFFSSVMLTNGSVYVAGGEYGNGNGYVETYNPLANAWSIVTGGFFSSDASAVMLPNGNVLQSDSQSGYWYYNVVSNYMQYVGGAPDMNEVAWVKMTNNCIFGVGNYGAWAVHYDLAMDHWVLDTNNTPSGAGGGDDAEFLLPNGKVFHVGSTAFTAIYTPGPTAESPGPFVNGPQLPMDATGTNQLVGGESPGAELPNGNILLELAPNGGGASGGGPVYFYEFNYLNNSFTQVGAPGGGSTLGTTPFVNSMLVLPDGSVLDVLGQNSGNLWVYTPTNTTALALGKPSISSVVENADGSYHLTGVGLSGISPGATYGDDEQMASDYPIVRLTNNATGYVYYARTHDWTGLTPMNPNPVTTEITLPQGLPGGTYSLFVVANGNASAPTTYVYAPPPIPTGLTASSGSNAFVNVRWNASAGATGYNIKRSLGSSGYFSTLATVGGTNYSDTGLTNGVIYFYKVAAVGGSGPSSDSAEVNATPAGPPPVPTGLTAVPDTFQRMNLAWSPSVGATSYNLKRSTTHLGSYTTVASLTNLAYIDSGLVGGTTYYYVVSAVSSGGESGNSVEAGATAQTIADFGFETPSLGGDNFQYVPLGGGWTFSGSSGSSGSGIVANGSGFSNPNAPEGVQAAFVQGHGVVFQVLSGFTPGTNYTITYSVAQRPGYAESWNVMIDSTVVKSNSPGGTSYAISNATFTATAVTHTLAFVGTDLANNQDALFLDNVTISPSLSTTVALPVLTQNTLPATAATVVGDSVTFTAAFSPAPPATYQWQFISTNNGVIANIPGATNSTLTLNNLQLTNSGFYRLAAINATNSQGVMFSGTSPLTVTTVPGAVNNVIASYAAQTGLGSVQPNFAPTWTVTPGSVIAGQSPSSVGAGNFSLAGGGVVSVLTDGTAGSINLYGAGSLTEVMCGNAYGAGQSVTYTLTNSLSPSGYNLTNIVVYGGWGDAGRDQQAYTVYYAKATAPTSFIQLGVVNFNPVNAAGVQSATRATLTPAAGVLASNVVAVMIDFTTPGVENGFVGYSEIDLYGASVIPVVTQNTLPATAADVVGSQVTFTAAISANSPIIYQWQKITNGVANNIPGATNSPTLTLTNLQLTDTASYQLVVSNANGVAVSSPGVLTVSSAPAPVNNLVTSYAAQTGLGGAQPSFSPTWTVAPGSLIAGQPPGSVGPGNFSLNSGGGVAVLTDGTFGYVVNNGNSTPTEVTCGPGNGAGQSVTYMLTGSATGYNLTNITTYGGWGDSGRDQQAFTIYYATTTAPTTFILLTNVNYNPPNPLGVQSATRATLTPASGFLLTNVAAVKFDFTTPGGENGYCGYSEIDLFGTPAAPPAIPLPILTQDTLPATAAYMVGDQVLFTAGFGNSPAASYQWQKIAGGVTNDVFGATSPTLTLNNVQLTDAGSYRLKAMNATNSGGFTYTIANPLTVASVPAAVNNVITKLAGQTGYGPVNVPGTSFPPTWSVTAATSMIAGQDPTSFSGNFDADGTGRDVNSLTAGGNGTIAVMGTTGNTTISPNYVLCGNGSGAGASAIYTLAGSASGGSLTNITVYGGWTNDGRDSQDYTVYYSTLAAPTNFVSLGSVNYNPANPGGVFSATRATLVPVAGALATNVAAVKFDFTTPGSENGYCGYSQIALFGIPVATGPATNPTNIVFQVSGCNLTLSWPADHIGWQLEAQTNSVTQGLGTNWFNVAGSTLTNRMTFPINPANGSVFYRLFLQ